MDQAQQMRFVKRGAEFKWVHALEMAAGDIDCSGMNDEEFESFVRSEDSRSALERRQDEIDADREIELAEYEARDRFIEGYDA